MVTNQKVREMRDSVNGMKAVCELILPKTLKMAAVRDEKKIQTLPYMKAVRTEAIEGEGLAAFGRAVGELCADVFPEGEVKAAPDARTVRPPRMS